jgi:hypothetical protein
MNGARCYCLSPRTHACRGVLQAHAEAEAAAAAAESSVFEGELAQRHQAKETFEEAATAHWNALQVCALCGFNCMFSNCGLRYMRCWASRREKGVEPTTCQKAYSLALQC